MHAEDHVRRRKVIVVEIGDGHEDLYESDAVGIIDMLLEVIGIVIDRGLLVRGLRQSHLVRVLRTVIVLAVDAHLTVIVDLGGQFRHVEMVEIHLRIAVVRPVFLLYYQIQRLLAELARLARTFLVVAATRHSRHHHRHKANKQIFFHIHHYNFLRVCAYSCKIGCKGTKKNAHMQIYVRFFC